MGFPQEAHTGLLGGAVPFSAITGFAGRYEVFPGVFSPVAAGNNMVYSQMLGAPTIGTPVSIPLEDVFSRKRNMTIRYRHIAQKPNDARPGISGTHSGDLLRGVAFYDFGLAKVDENERPPPGGDMDGLIVVV
jgi:hypothetical protein